MRINSIYSPNFDKKKRSKKSIKLLVMHYTGMQSERESLSRLCDPKFKVSCHYLIGESGNVHRLVQDNNVAWHAGKSCWGKYKNLNKNSIGIELVNKGHKFGYKNFKKKQIRSLIKISKKLIKKYKIKKQNIVGHSDIAPLRKIDPGEKFPWKELASNKIGNWHSIHFNKLRKLRSLKISKKLKKEFINDLIRLGYCLNGRKSNLTKTIKSFQRRYRKDLINGIIDKECLIIAKNISKKVKIS